VCAGGSVILRPSLTRPQHMSVCRTGPLPCHMPTELAELYFCPSTVSTSSTPAFFVLPHWHLSNNLLLLLLLWSLLLVVLPC